MPAINIADLNNAKQDVDHLAAIATSTDLAATDRFGRTKRTLAALEAEYPNAQANADAAAGSSEIAVAAKDLAQAAKAQAEAAKVAAEAARDAALIQAGVYPDEPKGRAAVGDGQTFNVQGSDDVAVTLYRRISAASSELLTQFPSASAVKAVRDDVSSKLDSSESPNLMAFSDESDRIFAFFDSNSGLVLEGLDGSVQGNINLISEVSEKVGLSEGEDVFQIFDNAESLVARIDSQGKLHLAGLGNSVQHLLENHGESGKEIFSSPKSHASKADLYCHEALASLGYIKVFGSICPVPKNGLLPQQYHVGTKWVDSIQAPIIPTNDYIRVGAFNDRGTATNWVADSGVVHPHVISFQDAVCGYKHWMAITPYTGSNEDIELPYVYGSNSDALDSWELIEGLPAPFDVDPKMQAEDPSTQSTSGHLSDPCFTYDASTGTLYLIWRRNLYFEGGRDRTKAKLALLARKTTDGQIWSDIFEVYPEYTDISRNILASPALLHNPEDGLFYIFYCNLSVNSAVWMQTTVDLESPNWSEPVAISGLDSISPYHLEARWVGDRIVLLMQEEIRDQLFFAASLDKTYASFKVGNSVFGEQPSTMYKATFSPVFDDDGGIGFRLLYTSDQRVSPAWRLYATQTNFVNSGDV